MVSVILPTYNEGDTLPVVIPRIVDVLRQRAASATGSTTGSTTDSGDFEILVVDDNSPDGTADRAAELARVHPVRVVRRAAARSLSASVVEGIQAAQGELVVVMDADGSHPPQKIPDLIAPVASGRYDMSVGSRYLPGGGCDGWSSYRLVLSRFAGLLARGVTTLSDPTSGFMCIRRNAAVAATVRPIGWKIVLEYAVQPGMRVVEVPFLFGGRIAGKSKANPAVTVLYLWHLLRLYRERNRSPRVPPVTGTADR